MTDLIGGRLDYFFATTVEVVEYVKAGRLRALAVTARGRVPYLPGVPTMIELGFPGFDPVVWHGFIVPAKTPAPIVQRLYAAFAKVLTDPDMQDHLRALGLTIFLGDPDDLAAFLRAEIARWGQVIRAANIRAEN